MNFNKYMKTKNINYALISLFGFLFIAFPLNINAEDEIKSESVESSLFILVADFDITHHCLVHHICLSVCLNASLAL